MVDWFELRYRLTQAKEKLFIWIAWHLPGPVLVWAFVRVATYGTVGKYGGTVLPELTIVEALKRWGDDHA